MTGIAEEAEAAPDTLSDEEGVREVWAPTSAVAVSESPSVRVARLLPAGAPNPTLGQSAVELTTMKYVLDGTFESDDPAAEAKVRELAQLAFQEFAERQGKSVEQLEHAAHHDPPVADPDPLP